MKMKRAKHYIRKEAKNCQGGRKEAKKRVTCIFLLQRQEQGTGKNTEQEGNGDRS